MLPPHNNTDNQRAGFELNGPRRAERRRAGRPSVTRRRLRFLRLHTARAALDSRGLLPRPPTPPPIPTVPLSNTKVTKGQRLKSAVDLV